jgi:biliverdin reductase
MIRFGFVGTGFVAQKRAEALAQDRRGQLVVAAGHTPAETKAFASRYGVQGLVDWPAVVEHPAVDVVVVCHVNRDHGQVAMAALQVGKHVVVEYPLATTATQGAAIIALAHQTQRLLHVEHIELLGAMHQALRDNLARVGIPRHVYYHTLSPRHPAPTHWTYCPELFGFPLIGALSRIRRLVDSFGPVTRVYCQNHYDGLQLRELPGDASPSVCHTTCRCVAQLTFTSGVLAEVIYAKGDQIRTALRQLTVVSNQGKLTLEPDRGEITSPEGTRSIVVGGRRGLLAADTRRVLDCLLDGKPLYSKVADSLYALRVAEAAQHSATAGQTVDMTDDWPGGEA